MSATNDNKPLSVDLSNYDSSLSLAKQDRENDLGTRMVLPLSPDSGSVFRMATSATQDFRRDHREWRAHLSILQDMGTVESGNGRS